MLGWIAETTVVATALAAVAALAGRVRPIGPTARHVLWLAVLVRLMIPPLVCWPWAVAWSDVEWPSLSRGAEPEPAIPTAPVGDGAGAPAPMVRSPAIEEIAVDLRPAREPSPEPTRAWTWDGIERTLIAGWLVATILLAAGQSWRILRFRRRLRMAVPAPDDLVAEAARIAGRIGGRVPELLVVPELGSPMLWCLGRPRLLLPAPLVRSIDRGRWRGILAHELAHLRRGDHWVSRLELLAGLVWWWNPLYWLARARLDAEAELACDAWVVWALPGDRLAYAEALFDIGSRLSRAVSPAPALGAAGPGRFLERRLIMILREQATCRVSPPFLLAAILLVLLAIPSWSAITPAAEPPAASAPALATPAGQGALVALADDDDDDADDDDDDARDKQKAKDKAKQAEAKAKQRAEARARQAEARARQAEARAKERAEAASKRRKSSDKAKELGPDFEKKMEALGKEMEANFGPGSDFEKKMKKLGEEMEAKFGPGSDFEKQMKKLGEQLESQLGPGSDFEKKMKDMGQKMKEKAEAAARKGAEAQEDLQRAQDRLDWAKKMKEKGYVSKSQLDREEAGLKQAQAARAASEKPKARATAKSRRRDARIADLEARIRKLSEELKALEAEDEEDER